MTSQNPASPSRLARAKWVSLAAMPLALLTVSTLTPLTPPATARQAAPDATGIHAQVDPLFQKYCYDCHNDAVKSGDVNLAKDKTALLIQKSPQNWKSSARRIAEKSMPPQRAPQPTSDERAQMAGGIEKILSLTPDFLLPKDPGKVLIHRLNRQEYNNTVRDLFGVTSNPADQFPADSGGGGGFDNNADTLYIPPILMERYLEAANQILREVKPERLFLTRPGKQMTPLMAARATLQAQATRAYRRPVTGEEVVSLLRLYGIAAQKGKGWEESVRYAMRAILISPNFLFRAEQDSRKAGAYRISDYELASRLSYFLWASLPDQELLRLAGVKRLHDPHILDAQVTRMLASPKSRQFAEAFTGQWLRVRELYTTAHPDTGKFPAYTPSLRDAMYQEPVLLFQSVVGENQSILTLLDAPYTFVNEDLAKHYGMAGVTGKQMRRVSTSDGRRGGVLTMASTLIVSSYPQRTSPVLRGKWILSDVLGTPPPPPPPVVATLSTDDGVSKEGLTFRQRLEKHRTNPNCAGCHSRLDPLGFALENYDAVGKWRDKIGEMNVDAEGAMPDGTKFTGPVEFKKFMLANRKTEFTQHLTEKMLSFALGRGLEPYDARAVRQITANLGKDDLRMRRLITEVVKSYPFQYRQNVAAPASRVAER